jgi:hypothetical protein
VEMYTNLCKWKMKPVEIILRMEEGRIKENDRCVEFNYSIL